MVGTVHDEMESLGPLRFGHPVKKIPVQHVLCKGPEEDSYGEQPSHHPGREPNVVDCDYDQTNDGDPVYNNILDGIGFGQTLQERILENPGLPMLEFRRYLWFHLLTNFEFQNYKKQR